MAESLLASLGYYVPEVIVTITMIALLYFEATYSNDEKGRNYVFIGATLGLACAAFALALNFGDKGVGIFTNSIVIDPFGTSLKFISVLGTLGAIWLCKSSVDIYQDLKSEFVIMSLGILIGGMLLISANNFLTVYLGVETLSILSYAVAAFKKQDPRSSEAGIKYSLYGGIASGIMLFGISHLYGMLGTIHFADLPAALGQLSDASLMIVAPSFLCFFVGLGYKISCVPFHMWTPDVYEGSPIPVTAFFSIVPKLAGIAAITRVSFVFFSKEDFFQSSWIDILWLVSALTMFIGNLCAIGQKSVKRMLAYSSIGHAGFMLMGVMVIDQIGVQSIVFYGATYLFMTMVAFWITSFVNDQYGNDYFDRFSGLIKKHPFMAIAMSFAMFSLAGLPPFAGFVAKFNILSTVINKGEYSIAIVGVINSVISLYYYMKIVRLMTLNEPEATEKIEGFNFLNQLIVVIMAIPVLLLGVFWSQLSAISHGSKLLTF